MSRLPSTRPSGLEDVGDDDELAKATEAPRKSAAARLADTLEERRAWVSSSANSVGGVSPPAHREPQPGEVRLPLRDVVHQCLDDWGIESDSSEDDDDICGWRVGSRAIPQPGDLRGGRSASGHGMPPLPGSRSSHGSGGSGRPPGRSCLLQ